MSFHLVTGASRGLGLALVSALLRDGHEVAAAARSPAPPGLDAATVSGRLSWHRLDLADGTAARDWARAAVRDRRDPGPVALILNAGIVEPLAAVRDLDPDALDRHLRLNLSSPMLVTAGALQGLRARADAEPTSCRVLAISSGAARYGVPHWAAYCAAKAGLDNFVRTLNAEADPANDGDGALRAVSLAPGVIDTAMQGVIRDTPAPKRERFLALHRDGALATADAAAAAILSYLRRDDFGAHEIDDLRTAATRDT